MGRALHFFFRICGDGLAILAMLGIAGCGGGEIAAPGNGGGGGGGGNGGGGGTANVAVSVSPKLAAVASTTQTQAFTATVTGDAKSLGVTWSVDSVAGGNATVGLITSTGLYTPPSTGGTHTITATSVANTSTSASATVAVTDLPGVLTFHNNLARDGTNVREFALTPANVTTSTFGKSFSCAVDGAVYAQPLWAPGITVGGAKHNVVFAATAHNSVFAFDADQAPCVLLWQANLLDAAHGAGAGEAAASNDNVGGSTDIQPEIGIIGTPVINPSSSTLYVVSKSEGPGETFQHRLHALDLANGSEKSSGPVNISATVVGAGYDSSGATVTFNPATHNQRSGLALVNGVVYVTWASHGDVDPYHGWIIGYNAGTLAQVATYNITADGSRGGIWMSGAAPAADSANAVYLSTGNGTMDHDSLLTPNTDLGDSVIKLSTASGISLSDWFSPFNQAALESVDNDLGSGGVVLLPDQPSAAPHLLVTGGKEGKLYLINRDSMGQFCSSCNSTTGDSNTVQFFSATNALFSTPAFWNGSLYVAGASDQLMVLALDTTTGKFNTSPTAQSANTFSFPGATPSISSQGTSNGIVWAIDSSQYGTPQNAGGPAVLHASDASNVATELWNSSQAANSRDQAGNAVKFTVPTVANGKVYIGTRTTIEAYGLLPQ